MVSRIATVVLMCICMGTLPHVNKGKKVILILFRQVPPPLSAVDFSFSSLTSGVVRVKGARETPVIGDACSNSG